MDRQPFILSIAAFGIVSGIFSPLTYFMRLWLLNFFPAFFIDTPSITILVSSLFTATIVIMLAGIPAAIYERLSGLRDSNSVSLWIWLACTALISVPAIANAVRYFL